MVKQGENYSIVGNPIKIMKNNVTIDKPSTTMAKLEQDNRKIVEQRQIISTFRSITDKAFRDQTIKDVSRVRAHLKSSCF